MTAEWDDLARLAEAATPGPWEATQDGLTHPTGWEIDGPDGRVVSECCGYTGPVGETADAEFIAAANPATILRLIEQLRQERVCYTDECGEPCRSHVALLWAERDTARQKVGLIGQRLGKVRAERDALAARLSAVEALADEWERRAQLAESTADARAGLSDEVSLRQHAVVMSNRAADLRSVLSAAPTDTTKEN